MLQSAMHAIVQVTKLDTDPASAAAKPGSAAPAKVTAPAPSTHDPKTGPWVRFWQDKPQHWGVPPAVKSTVDLAAANIQRNSASPSKPPTELAAAHHNAVRSSLVTATPSVHGAGSCDMQALDQAAGTAARIGGSGSAAESSAAAVSAVRGFARSSSDDQASAGAVTAKQSSEPVTAAPESALAESKLHSSLKAAASTITAASGAPKPTSVPVSAAAAGNATGADASAAPAKPAGKQAGYNMYSPSKGTLQVLRKPPSKEPSPRKQVPLQHLLARQAAQGQPHAQGRVTSSEDPHQQQRQQQQQQQQHPQQTGTAAEPMASVAAAELPVSRIVLPGAAQLPAHSNQHAKLQGLTLSQIDASVFAALPAEHQQDLLHNLPKSTNRPSGAAPVQSKHMGASDFAFITKLANLQKGGQSRSSSALDTNSSKAADNRPQASPKITVAAAEGTDTRLDRSRGEGLISGMKATHLGPSKQPGATALPPSVAVLPAPDQEAERPEEGADAPVSSPGDPAFISQLSADSSAGHAAHHASSSVVDEGIVMLDERPTAFHQQSDTSKPATSAQQAQHAQQAQQPATPIKPATDAAGNNEDNNMDQALDMDLMEEEWVAFAAQGQRAEPNNRDQTLAQPTSADSAPFQHAHHSLAQHDSEVAHSSASPKHSSQLNASSAAGPVQQQMQECRAAGVQQQPVSPLPPPSQIDSSVLDALPLQVRRELELAYGISTCSCSCVHAVCAQQEHQLCAGQI